MKNGNKNKNLIILNWNKGNSNFINRVDTIHQIIIEQNPDIFAIQEANIREQDDIRLFQMEGYQLELDNLLETKGIARAIMYIKNDIKYRRLKDIESKIEPIIWVEIQQMGKKTKNTKFL